jgi:hypothetical protein
MDTGQDDKTTIKHLMIIVGLFLVLGFVMIVGANMIG